MLSQQEISLKQIQTYATIYFCIYGKNNKQDISKIKDFDLDKIQQELTQFIRNSERLNPKIIRENTSRFLEKILKFNKKQQKFIDAFFKEHIILTNLIDIDAKKLEKHPALLHKLRKLKHKI
jgi:hypothetical protein